MTEFVRVQKVHPGCVKLPCRYENCTNERWVCNTTDDYTVCSDCYDGPDISNLVPKPSVPEIEVNQQGVTERL